MDENKMKQAYNDYAMRVIRARVGNARVVKQARALPNQNGQCKYTRRPSSANEAVRQAFLNGEWLTERKVRDSTGCSRFRSILTELRYKGWIFFDEWVYGKNRYGKRSRWKRNRLLKAGA